MAKKKKSPLAAPAQEQFRIVLNLGGDITEGSGATALDALRALPKPEKIMTKAHLEVFKGDKQFISIYTPQRLKRLFYSNPKMQEIQAKQLSVAFN